MSEWHHQSPNLSVSKFEPWIVQSPDSTAITFVLMVFTSLLLPWKCISFLPETRATIVPSYDTPQSSAKSFNTLSCHTRPFLLCVYLRLNPNFYCSHKHNLEFTHMKLLSPPKWATNMSYLYVFVYMSFLLRNSFLLCLGRFYLPQPSASF